MLSPRYSLALLLLIAAVRQFGLVSSAVMPAQDAVDFVSVAQAVERDGLWATIRREPVAPLFPASVAAVHGNGVRLRLLDTANWSLAAQIAAAIPCVVAVVPVYLLSRRLVGATGATISALIFCLLPEAARLGGDGISDALHLCLTAWAIWALSVAVDSANGRKQALFGLAAGLFTSAALWTRAEAIVVGLAAIGFLAVSILKSMQSRRVLVPFAAGLAVWLVPFAAAGIFDRAELWMRLRGGAAPTESVPLNVARYSSPIQPPAPSFLLSDGEPMVFGHKDRTRSTRFHGLTATCVQFVAQLGRAAACFVALFAALGFWMRIGEGLRPMDRLLAAILAAHLSLLFGFAYLNGYLSARHFLPAVVVLLPYAGHGVVSLASWIVTRLSTPDNRRAMTVTGTLAFVSAVACLLVAARPLHESQLAHRRAAEWLQSEAAIPGAVLDQRGLTALETGRTTYRFDAAETALADPRLAYVVVERADLEAASRRGQSLRSTLGAADKAIVVFRHDGSRPERDVLVFCRKVPRIEALPSPAFITQLQTNHAR